MANVKTYALLAMGLLVAAVMIPLGMQQIITTTVVDVSGTTYDWNSAVVTMWQVLLPVLMIIGIAILFVPHGGGKT